MTDPVSAPARLSRLLALVPWLAAHDGVTLDEAADHFGISAAQLEKDLWLLVCSGLPGHGPDDLVDIQFWDDGRIHVLDPQTLARPMRLTPDEVMSLLVGLRLLRQVPGDHDRAALDSAMAKLERAAGELAQAAGRVTVAVDVPAEVADLVERAVRERRALTITYAGAARDEVSSRTVDPMRVLVADGRTYLEGWCRLAEAVRTFRLDRILSADLLDEPAVPPADARPVDLDDGGLRPSSATVTLDLDPQAAWVVDVHPVLSSQPLADGGIRAVLPVGDPQWVVRLVLGLGGAARVLEPPEVAVAVREGARAALAAYDA
jgi:proteasome accessory factor C